MNKTMDIFECSEILRKYKYLERETNLLDLWDLLYKLRKQGIL